MIHVKCKPLKILMLRLGITGIELSKQVGITQGYISQILSGKRSPSAPIAKHILSVLGCEFDDIFEIEVL